MKTIELVGKPLFKLDQHDGVQIYQCYLQVNKTLAIHPTERTFYIKSVTIIRRFGLLGGKLQTTPLPITEGKNLGKSNETSIYEQAKAEAEAFVKEKREAGYKSFSLTTQDFGNTVVEEDQELPIVPRVTEEYYNVLYNALKPFQHKGYLGRIQPMLAQDLFKGGKEQYDVKTKTVKRELKSKLNFPVAVQAKYDGIRCVVDCRDGDNPTLTSRGGQDLTKTHWRIINNLKTYLKESKLKNVIYDCELYADENFQDLIAMVKAPDNYPIFADKLYLVCYDVVDTEKSFQGRFLIETHKRAIKNSTPLKRNAPTIDYLPSFKFAHTFVCENMSQIRNLHDDFVAGGYEGAMVRILDSRYEPDKRSKGLLKYKVFDCDEFEIYGVEERKKEVVFRLRSFSKTGSSDSSFYCTPPGTKEENNAIRNNPSDYIGKMVTIKYFGLTKDGLPRMPKAVAYRDYE